jgi:hypothetical protein
MEGTEILGINVLFLILYNTHSVFLYICTTYCQSESNHEFLCFTYGMMCYGVLHLDHVSVASLALPYLLHYLVNSNMP